MECQVRSMAASTIAEDVAIPEGKVQAGMFENNFYFKNVSMMNSFCQCYDFILLLA